MFFPVTEIRTSPVFGLLETPGFQMGSIKRNRKTEENRVFDLLIGWVNLPIAPGLMIRFGQRLPVGLPMAERPIDYLRMFECRQCGSRRG